MANNSLETPQGLAGRTWLKVLIQFVLATFAMTFVQAVAPDARELTSGSVLNESLNGTAGVVVWVSFIFCYRAIFYDRYTLYIGLFAGALWLTVGDFLVAPFWAGLMAILLHFYRSRSKFPVIFAWYILLGLAAISAYTDLYRFFAHPVYLVLYALLFLGAGPFALKLRTAHQNWKAQKATTAKTKEAERAAAAKKKEAERLAVDKKKEMEQSRPVTTEKQYDIQIARLYNFHNLPASVQIEINKIIAQAEKIRHCMVTDPRDEARGRQFLERYLPVIYNVVNKAKSMGWPDEEHQVVITFLQDQASPFDAMYQELLKNDKDDLKAEIALGEQLLRMDGFKK